MDSAAQDLYGSAAPAVPADQLDTSPTIPKIIPPAPHQKTPVGEEEHGRLEEAEDKDEDKMSSSFYKVAYGDGGLSDLQRLGLLGAVVAAAVLYIRYRRRAARQREFDEKVMA